MNLVIDFGNTQIKCAQFNNLSLTNISTFTNSSDLLCYIASLSQHIEQIALSSVTFEHVKLVTDLKKTYPVFQLNANSKLPIKIVYKSPETLGADRIAASLGAYAYFKKSNVLTIDAGTCVKYNFVNECNEFEGGAISPGINMRLKALNEHTHALPLLNFNKDYSNPIGTNTHESILSGALNGTIFEVEGMIKHYQTKYKNLQVCLTGGDSDYLSKHLKNRFFASQNLILTGINLALNYQN
ncbi:MAG: type III pantothenate kinase [Bacteroidetes bacterium]|nr:type III pantothenate kinase [Bacteroidota bacterium]